MFIDCIMIRMYFVFFFFQAEDGIRDLTVTGVQTCALPILISLGAGEPDFDTPAHIAQAGKDAIQGGFTRYTNVEGIDELKDAIIAKFERDNALTYERSQILVSAGAKQILYNLAMAVIDPGDEAIIPAPYWVSYPDMVLLADGQPVMPFAGMAQGYKITPQIGRAHV